MNDLDAKRLRRIVIGVLRLADDDKAREEFFRKLGVATRHAARVWVRDHSGFPPELKKEILGALDRAERPAS